MGLPTAIIASAIIGAGASIYSSEEQKRAQEDAMAEQRRLQKEAERAAMQRQRELTLSRQQQEELAFKQKQIMNQESKFQQDMSKKKEQLFNRQNAVEKNAQKVQFGSNDTTGLGSVNQFLVPKKSKKFLGGVNSNNSGLSAVLGV